MALEVEPTSMKGEEAKLNSTNQYIFYLSEPVLHLWGRQAERRGGGTPEEAGHWLLPALLQREWRAGTAFSRKNQLILWNNVQHRVYTCLSQKNSYSPKSLLCKSTQYRIIFFGKKWFFPVRLCICLSFSLSNLYMFRL